MGRAEEIIKAWDPDQESATALAERIGISKARLYQVLSEEGVTPKARRPTARRRTREPVKGSLASYDPAFSRGPPLIGMGEDLRSLLDELTDLLEELGRLRQEVAGYRDRYGPLK